MQAVGHDALITEGTCQSNHCRATAAVCAKLGFQPRLLFRSSSTVYTNGNDYYYAACDQNCTVGAQWSVVYVLSNSAAVFELNDRILQIQAQRGQHRRASGLGDAGPAVEHPAHGRLAHAHVLRHFGKTAHGRKDRA